MLQTPRPTSHVSDMTQGEPIKLILAFAIPLFIGNIFQQVYSPVDHFGTCVTEPIAWVAMMLWLAGACFFCQRKQRSRRRIDGIPQKGRPSTEGRPFLSKLKN